MSSAEVIWGAFRNAYGNKDKNNTIKSGLLPWHMLDPYVRAAFETGVQQELERLQVPNEEA